MVMSAPIGSPSAQAPAPGSFPKELTDWVPYEGNPLFSGTGANTWDREIRERGFVLREPSGWKLWYTGYDPTRSETRHLGYATSSDGIHWTRHPANPIFTGSWTEDVFVLRHDGGYQMFAEGTGDVAHRLSSADGLTWQDHGPLDVRTKGGIPIEKGPYGTPTVWFERGTFHLFYERNDRGVWLATSRDLRTWTNVQDDPVIGLGPADYDRHAVALNQVVRHRGRYYAIYHANADAAWKGPWTTCIAASDDLVHWTKYEGNPVIRSNDSSGILVDDAGDLRLYTMHPAVKLWRPRGAVR